MNHPPSQPRGASRPHAPTLCPRPRAPTLTGTPHLRKGGPCPSSQQSRRGRRCPPPTPGERARRRPAGDQSQLGRQPGRGRAPTASVRGASGPCPGEWKGSPPNKDCLKSQTPFLMPAAQGGAQEAPPNGPRVPGTLRGAPLPLGWGHGAWWGPSRAGWGPRQEQEGPGPCGFEHQAGGAWCRGLGVRKGRHVR